jgi:hypothetical protein
VQAFSAVLGCSDTPTDEIQARFAQAISHLQMLGLVKQTKRKADHLQRLTVQATS